MAEDKQVDFVLVFALEKELRAFLSHLGEFETRRTDIHFHRAEVRVGKSDVYRIVAFRLPEMGNYAAAAATTRAIDVWNPRFILLGGIAGGVKGDDVRLGDVVVADLIVAYEPGKQKPKGLDRRFKVLDPARVLVEAAKDLNPREWALNAKVPRPGGETDRTVPRVHFGTVASGEKVIASSGWFKELAASFKDSKSSNLSRIIGVEMESYGTALAAYRAPTAPGMFMAKAICDWADASKNDDWQAYAADISATFLMALLKKHPVPTSVLKEQATRLDAKPYSSRSKLGLCKRMANEWEDLADYYDIPLDERRRFRRGRECQDVWEWLENRKKLDGLPDALKTIGREDLVDELIPAS